MKSRTYYNGVFILMLTMALLAMEINGSFDPVGKTPSTSMIILVISVIGLVVNLIRSVIEVSKKENEPSKTVEK